MDLNVLIVHGNIMKEETDVIVNPSNPDLSHGGGLCGVIFDAVRNAGPQHYAHLVAELSQIGGCEYGDAKITSAAGLPFKAIIHTVGADARVHQPPVQRRIIEQCYYRCMQVANSTGFGSISMPLISAGIYGCDVDLVVAAFFAACDRFLRKYPSGRTLTVARLVVLDFEDFNRISVK